MQTDSFKYLPAPYYPEAELLPPDRVFHVAGRSWCSMNVRRMVYLEGHTILEILTDVLRRTLGQEPTDFQRRAWLDRCRCKVDGVEIPAGCWDTFRPAAGSFVEFLAAPGKGGGGGKNILRPIMMIAVAIASIYTFGAAAAAFGAMYGVAATAVTGATTFAAMSAVGTVAGALAAGAVYAVGSWAVSKICPTTVSPQQTISSSAAKNSPTYSINGGRNQANPFGYVPLVLGRFRLSGPLAAKSWTKQEGDDQYFNMCVIWGHADMSVTDFRIGETPLANFEGVDHQFHGSTTGDDLVYFGRSYNEQSVGAAMTYNNPVTRVVGECDRISVDVYFPALAELSRGSASSAAVQFKIEYALVGTDDWKTYGASTRFFAPAQYKDGYTGASQDDAWASNDGVWHVRQSNEDWGNPNFGAGMIRVTESGWDVYPISRYKDKHKHHEWWFRDATYDAGTSTTLTVSGAQTTPLTKSYEWAVPHGEYQVRLTRLTPDSTSDTLYNECTWSTARAIVNRPAFNTPIPVCCSELHIKANEQLSGYVDNFNALCCSVLPVYQPDKGGWAQDEDGDWITDETQNPADILRYLFLSRHALNNPYTQAKIDEAALGAFWRYCQAQDYHFDFVCDSETSAWSAWTAAASAGRGAVTTDNDGLFGVTIDNAEKVPVQMFTPRNSWGFSIERQFYTMPHALRVSFYDEGDDYTEKEGFVYADGYSKTNATDIVEWNFTGKTRWADLYRMGRYYLASMRLRPVTVTLSTDWEWMMCRRGDVVGVAHDVLMNTFGTARIVALIYRDSEGKVSYVTREEDKPADAMPVGVRLDDSVHFSEDAGYGIAIRQNTGKLLTYQVQHTLNDMTPDMFFVNALTEPQVPYIGALAAVSTLGSEYAEYLLASISVNNDNSAELTLVPWAMPQILEAESGEIPPWEPPIKLDTIGHANRLPPPIIREIRSDESVLVRSGDALICQIAVWWKLPDGIPAEFKRIYVQLHVKDAEGNVFNAQVDPTTSPYISVAGVEEGQTYTVYLRLVSDTGVTSEWTEGVPETVVGKTSPPPDITGLKLSIEDPQGIRVDWDELDDLLDLSHYKLTGYTAMNAAHPPVYLYPTGKTGTVTEVVQGVDIGGRESLQKAEGSVTILPPATPVPEYEVQPLTGALIRWQNCKTTWSIDHYAVQDHYAGADLSVADAQFSISPRPIGDTYAFTIVAVDIFGNRSTAADISVGIGEMGTPEPFASIDGTQIVIHWEAISAPFAIDVYEIETQDGVRLGTVKGTTFRFLAPAAGTHGYRVRAVDISGQTSPWGECSITLKAPYTPVVTAKLDGEQIALSWTQKAPAPDMVPVIAWDIVRQWETTRPDGVVETHEEDYGRNDTLALSVPAVTVGIHTFMVRAVDNAGNLSGWGSVDFRVQAPGRVTFFDCSAIDNNVMIYYTTPSSVFFPIREYLVEDMEDGIGAAIGRTDAQFFADIKQKSGAYTYGVTPVDIAGNLGTRSTITIQVSQPPDFIMYNDYDSLFNGKRENMELDGEGNMFGPVYPNETWQENAERDGGLLGIAPEELTWQNKVDAGYIHYQSPPLEQGVYTEVVDIGVLVPSSKLQVTVTSRVLEGDPTMRCKIELSEDNETWRTVTEDGLSVYVASFRYIRYTFTWTNGMVLISNINFRLDVKRKMDFGQVEVGAEDNGDGWVSESETPMLTGKWVDFVVGFTDVQSFPRPNVVNDQSADGLTAFVVFEDVLNPTGFRLFVKDKQGRRVSAVVDWAAYGV